MFYNCSSITSLDLSNFNGPEVINIQALISHCYKLKYVNLDNFVENVTKMQLAFRNCYSLEYLNLPKFKSDKVIYTFGLFENCYSLLYLNLSHFSF